MSCGLKNILKVQESHVIPTEPKVLFPTGRKGRLKVCLCCPLCLCWDQIFTLPVELSR